MPEPCTQRLCDDCFEEYRQVKMERQSKGAYSAHGQRTSYGKTWRQRRTDV